MGARPSWLLHDHEMRIWRTSPHNPRATALGLIGKAGRLGIKRPDDQPSRRPLMRSSAGRPRISGTPIAIAIQLVNNSGLRVGGLRLVRHPVQIPLQGGVHAGGAICDHSDVASNAGETIMATRRTVMFPFSSISTTLASRATFEGAAESARLIFVSFDSASFGSAATIRLAMSRTNKITNDRLRDCIIASKTVQC